MSVNLKKKTKNWEHYVTERKRGLKKKQTKKHHNRDETKNKIQSFCISGALVYVLRFPGHPQDQKAFSDLRNWLEKKKQKQNIGVLFWNLEPSENRILHISLQIQ